MQKVYIAVFVLLTIGHYIETRSPIICPIACPEPCLAITCPKGTETGYSSVCQCCPTCVIPQGGECPWMGDKPDRGDVDCEVYTQCCAGICSKGECETTTSETTTESSTETTTESCDVETTTDSSTETTTESCGDETTTDPSTETTVDSSSTTENEDDCSSTDSSRPTY